MGSPASPRPPQWRPGMSKEEEQALLDYCAWLDECYAESAAIAEELAGERDPVDDDDVFDPVRDGWVGRNGRP